TDGAVVSGDSRTVSLAPVSDALLEGDETVDLALSNPSGVSTALGNASNTTTITDDESATLDIASTSSVTEAGGAQDIAVTLTITGTTSGADPFALGKGVVLSADVTDATTGTATGGTDYSFST